MTCACTPCGREAVAWCQWGSDALPAQSANLCQLHVEELAQRLDPLLKVNIAWFRIDQPKE